MVQVKHMILYIFEIVSKRSIKWCYFQRDSRNLVFCLGIATLGFLSFEEERNHSNLPTENKYLFLFTKGSDNHVSGWHSIPVCCRKSNFDDHVNGTMNQYRVSSLVGALGISIEFHHLLEH